MRSMLKKTAVLLLVVLMWLSSFGGSFLDYGKVVLDIGSGAGTAYTDALVKEVTVPGGLMSYKVPKSFSAVETKLAGTAGYQYKLNEIPETYQTAAEQLYVFYFENEKYLLYKDDGKNTAAVEMAIVQNILPGEKVSGIVAGSGFPSAVKHNRNYTEFDYYTSEYTDVNRKTHHVEFVFTKDGTRGLGCLVYVFTDPVHKDDILYVMNSIRFAK